MGQPNQTPDAASKEGASQPIGDGADSNANDDPSKPVRARLGDKVGDLEDKDQIAAFRYIAAYQQKKQGSKPAIKETMGEAVLRCRRDIERELRGDVSTLGDKNENPTGEKSPKRKSIEELKEDGEYDSAVVDRQNLEALRSIRQQELMDHQERLMKKSGIPAEQREAVLAQMKDDKISQREMFEYMQFQDMQDAMRERRRGVSGQPDPQVMELKAEIARMKEGPKTDPAVLQVIADLKDRLVQKDRRDEIAELKVEAEKREAAAEQHHQEQLAAVMAHIEEMKAGNAALQAALMDKQAQEAEQSRREKDEARDAQRIATENESRRQYAEMFAKNQDTMLAFFEKHMNQQAQQLLASQPQAGSPIDKIRGWKDDVLKLKGEFEEMQKIFGAKTSSEIELARDSTFDKVADKFAPVLGQLINLATVVGSGGQQQKATPLPPGAMPPTVQPPNMVQQAQAQALPPPGSVPHPVPRAAPKGGLPEPRVPNMDQPLLVQSTNELYVPPPVYSQVLADLQMFAPDITPHIIISDTTQGKEMMIPPGLSERAMKAMILAHQKRNEPSPVEPPPATPPPAAPAPPAKPYRSLPTAQKRPKPAPTAPPPEPTNPPADSQTSTSDGQQPQ